MGIEVWMPLYTGDILASCADMSPAQFGAYMRLLCYAWHSGGLPNDMEACCRIAGGCTPADWSVVRKRLVVLDEGTSQERLSQVRLEAERATQTAKHKNKVEAMAKARAARLVHNTDNKDENNPVINTDNSPVIRGESESESESESDILNTSPSEKLGPTRQKPRRSYRVTWDSGQGFQGVTDADIARWKAAYPGVDLTLETARAHAWLVDNPTKAGKRNWGAFLNRWFSRVQDKGGSVGGSKPVLRTFRPDAGRELTAEEYADWKRRRDTQEFLAAKARKRSGLTSLGDVIDGRTE